MSIESLTSSRPPHSHCISGESLTVSNDSFHGILIFKTVNSFCSFIRNRDLIVIVGRGHEAWTHVQRTGIQQCTVYWRKHFSFLNMLFWRRFLNNVKQRSFPEDFLGCASQQVIFKLSQLSAESQENGVIIPYFTFIAFKTHLSHGTDTRACHGITCHAITTLTTLTASEAKRTLCAY